MSAQIYKENKYMNKNI